MNNAHMEEKKEDFAFSLLLAIDEGIRYSSLGFSCLLILLNICSTDRKLLRTALYPSTLLWCYLAHPLQMFVEIARICKINMSKPTDDLHQLDQGQKETHKVCYALEAQEEEVQIV